MTSHSWSPGSWLDYCYKAGLAISLEDRARELTLHNKKWFDYRFIPPWLATIRFASHLDAIPRSPADGRNDRYRAAWTSAWRARQFADELGLPYGVFVTAASTAISPKRPGKVQLNQLYGSKRKDEIKNAAFDRWARRRREMLNYSKVDLYRNEAFANMSAQVEHRNWVLSELKDNYTTEALGEVVFVQRTLPEDMALAEFGQAEIDRARDAVTGQTVADYVTLERAPWRSCFGLVGAIDTSNMQCLSCVTLRECGTLAAKIQSALKEEFGTDDLVEKRNRKNHSRRQKEYRRRREMIEAELDLRPKPSR
jgi:hypothetical protein